MKPQLRSKLASAGVGDSRTTRAANRSTSSGRRGTASSVSSASGVAPNPPAKSASANSSHTRTTVYANRRYSRPAASLRTTAPVTPGALASRRSSIATV